MKQNIKITQKYSMTGRGAFWSLKQLKQNLLKYSEYIDGNYWRTNYPTTQTVEKGVVTLVQSQYDATIFRITNLQFYNSHMKEGDAYVLWAETSLEDTGEDIQRHQVKVNLGVSVDDGVTLPNIRNIFATMGLLPFSKSVLPFTLGASSIYFSTYDVTVPVTFKYRKFMVSDFLGYTVYSTGDSICSYSIQWNKASTPAAITDSGNQYTQMWCYDKRIVAKHVGGPGEILSQIHARMVTDLENTFYPVILIEGGINDVSNLNNTPLATMQAEMSAMIDLAKDHSDMVIVINIPPSSEINHDQAKHRDFNDWLVTECANKGAHLIDAREILGNGGGPYGMNMNPIYYGYGTDPLTPAEANNNIHPNAKGHAAIAAALNKIPLPKSAKIHAIYIKTDTTPSEARVEPLDFNNEVLEVYNGNDTGTVVTDGYSVTISGSLERRVVINYDVTKDTVLEFDLNVEIPGTFVGAGMAENTDETLERYFGLAGGQKGKVSVKSYGSPNTNEWRSYQLHVGEHYTGSNFGVILGTTDGKATFRNIRVYDTKNKIYPKPYGRKYYVALDGNDSNPGTIDQPLQTITAVNALPLQPNDQVLFKGGDTFRGTIRPVSGNTDGRVIYSSYGDGKAYIVRSVNRSNASDWTDSGNNIWYFDISWPQDIANIIFDRTVCGIKKWGVAELTTQGDFYWDNTAKRLHLYSTANPGSMFSSIECSTQLHTIDEYDRSYIQYENLHMRYTGGHGIRGANTHHIIIRNCDFSYIGGAYRYTTTDGDNVRYGNAVEFFGNAHDHLVENNRMWEIFDNAMTNQGTDIASQYNIVWRNNIAWNCEITFSIWLRPTESMLRDVIFENNTLVHSDRCWGHNQRFDPRDVNVYLGWSPASPGTILIRNNIFYMSGEYLMFAHIGGRPANSVTMRNNCWYTDSSVPYIDVYTAVDGDSFIYVNEFEERKGETGFDISGSILAKPIFADEENNDYRQSPKSPAYGIGAE